MATKYFSSPSQQQQQSGMPGGKAHSPSSPVHILDSSGPIQEASDPRDPHSARTEEPVFSSVSSSSIAASFYPQELIQEEDEDADDPNEASHQENPPMMAPITPNLDTMSPIDQVCHMKHREPKGIIIATIVML